MKTLAPVVVAVVVTAAAVHVAERSAPEAAGSAAAVPAPKTLADPAVDMRGLWHNERGSAMRIDAVDADGRIAGAYQSAVGRAQPGAWHPVTGFVHGDVVAFAVAFPEAGSAVSWSGQVDGEGRIVTLWHLAKNVPDADEAKGLWAGILSGADTFSRP